MSLRRKRLYLFTIALMTVLTLLPATGWLVRAQILSALGFEVPGGNDIMTEQPLPDAAIRRYVERHPTDVTAQLGAALALDDTHAQLAILHERYPDNAAISATYLRLSCWTISVGHGKEQNFLYSQKRDFSVLSEKDSRYNRPEDLARFDAIALSGQKHDPENAFFPLMRSIGLLAQDRDEEAIASFVHAGTLTTYQDYQATEFEARESIEVKATGHEIGGMARMELAIPRLVENSSYRALARVATGMAIQAELAGDPAIGLKIRKAVTRMGAIMRSDGSSYTTSLVGSAITAIAASRPNGAEILPKIPDDKDGMKRRAAHIAAYTTYLKSIGESSEADYYKAESDAMLSTKSVGRAALNRPALVNPDFDRLFALWGAASILLSCLATSVLFAGLFGLLNHFSTRTQAGSPMSPQAKWGIWLGLTSLLSAAVIIGRRRMEMEFLGFSPLILPFLVLTIAPLRGKFDVKSIGRGVGIACLTGLLVSALGWLLWVPFTSLIQPYLPTGTEDSDSLVLPIPLLIGIGMLLISPYLLLLGLMITSRILRVPVSVGLTRSYSSLAGLLLVACTLLYASLVLATVPIEAHTIQSLHKSYQHEGRHYASITGMTWPEATPRPENIKRKP